MKFVKSKRDVFLAAILVTLLSNGIGVFSVIAVFPPEDWFRISVFLVVIGTPVAFTFQLITNFALLKNREMAEQFGNIVCKDALTGVATRHFFFQRMEMTPDAHGAVLMVDIDHFKRVNDTYGHQMGDEAIRTVAQTLTTLCRGQDMVCRFGGEEFVIFVYEVDGETAHGIAEILRESVAHEPICFGGQEIFATASIGVSMKRRSDHIDDVIGIADAALYKAKEGGRNRVEVSWSAKDTSEDKMPVLSIVDRSSDVERNNNRITAR